MTGISTGGRRTVLRAGCCAPKLSGRVVRALPLHSRRCRLGSCAAGSGSQRRFSDTSSDRRAVRAARLAGRASSLLWLHHVREADQHL